MIWTIEEPYIEHVLAATHYAYRGKIRIERRKDPEAILVASQVLHLATDNQINGLAAVLINASGGHQLVVAGTAFDIPIYTSGALGRLQALLDCHPTHPAEK